MQDTELPEKIEPTSLNFQTELAAQLAELVPEAMSDGKLDVTKLREMVNGDAENSPEKFGLFWPGKRAAQALAQIPTTATLIPAPEESEDWDSTKNIFIEGDNLEVLKALQNSYRRKVKMIYIDPPYNTGKEFIYPDKFSEGLQGYLEYTGQKNEAGENIESKPETGGRRHSNWLSMMYPRLQIAKSLLRRDGLAFISIGEDELHNLTAIADEVFGNENRLTTISRLMKSGGNKGQFFSPNIDYILVYARDLTAINSLRIPLEQEYVDKIYNKTDNGRRYREMGLYQSGLDSRPNQRYWIECPDGELVIPPGSTFPDSIPNETVRPNRDDGVWRWSIETFKKALENGEIEFKKTATSSLLNGQKQQAGWNIYTKIWLDNRLEEGRVPKNIITEFENRHSSSELKVLNIPFDFAKPTGLIEHLILISGAKNDDVIIDFFSGSSSTAHAVMKLNASRGGNLQHIQVQLPEHVQSGTDPYRQGFRKITDISKERIRRAGKNIHENFAEKIAKRDNPLDTGFRVYKLAPSNFVQWDENKAKDDIQQSVLDFAANKKPNAVPEALLAEIMLQARMPLSANIEKRELQSGGWVYVVDEGNLIVYVANEQITEAQANEIADLAPAKLIVLDSAFNGNNALKINVANICKEKFIKEFKTI